MNLIKYFTPKKIGNFGKDLSGQDLRFRNNILITYHLIISVASFLYILPYLYLKIYVMSLMCLFCFLLFFGLLFYYKRCDSFEHMASISLVFGLIMMIVSSLQTGGIRSPVLIWITVIPIFTNLLLNHRKSLYYIFFGCLIFPIVYFMELYVPSLFNSFPDELEVKMFVGMNLGVILTTSALVLGFVYQNNLIKNEVSKTNEELEQILGEKKNIIRILSHDISNHLTLIFQSSSIALKKINELSQDKIKERLNRVLRSSQNISDIITNIRTIEAMNDQKKSLNLTSISLHDLIEEGLRTFQNKLEEKSIRINQRYPTDYENLRFIGDRVFFLNNVMNNLLSNAIKFSFPHSSIDLEVSRTTDEIIFKIRDHGVGIPPTIKQNLFSSSKETSRVGTAGESGTGFGMPIVKAYLDQSYGRIYVESTCEAEDSQKHGTTFHIYLKISN